jgi:hypothetical protein
MGNVLAIIDKENRTLTHHETSDNGFSTEYLRSLKIKYPRGNIWVKQAEPGSWVKDKDHVWHYVKFLYNSSAMHIKKVKLFKISQKESDLPKAIRMAQLIGVF